MKTFYNESLNEILEYSEKLLKSSNTLYFKAINPDIQDNIYAGEIIKLDKKYKYRSYRVWNDFANILQCKMLTPIKVDENIIQLGFKKITIDESFHKNTTKNLDDKYGMDSEFSRINKNEEISFLYYYKQALTNAKIQNRNSILNLGINKGDEFDVIKHLLSKEKFKKMKFTGIDFSESVISYAQNRFNTENFTFHRHDINKLDEIKLDKFDLIISIGTLQSSNIDFKKVFMSLIQNYLNHKGSIILGFPNCRWIDGELIYGAKAPNYIFSEQSLLYKDVYFCKKYLQQKKFRVTLTGKDYLFLTATSIKK